MSDHLNVPKRIHLFLIQTEVMHYFHCLPISYRPTLAFCDWLSVLLHPHSCEVPHNLHTLFKMPPSCYVPRQQQLPSPWAAATLLNFTIDTCLCCCQRRRAASPSSRQGGMAQMMAAGGASRHLTDLGIYMPHTCLRRLFFSALCWYLGCAGLWKKDHLQVDKEDLAPSITLWINRRCLRAAIKVHCSMLSLLSALCRCEWLGSVSQGHAFKGLFNHWNHFRPEVMEFCRSHQKSQTL